MTAFIEPLFKNGKLNEDALWVLGVKQLNGPDESPEWLLPKIYTIPEGAELRKVVNGKYFKPTEKMLEFILLRRGESSPDHEAWKMPHEGPPYEDGYYWLHQDGEKLLCPWRLSPVDAELMSDVEVQVINYRIRVEGELALIEFMKIIGIHDLLFAHPTDPDKMCEVRR